MQNHKVLFVGGGAYVFGAEKINLEIINAAHQSGLYVYCTVSGWNDGAYISYLKERKINYKEIYLGWYYIRKLSWTLDSLVHAPRAYLQYFFLLKKIKPDVTYHCSTRTLFLLKPFLKNRNVLHVHDDSFTTRQGRSLLKVVDKKISLYIACSDFIKKRLLTCGVRESKIAVIYNFTDFKQYENELPEKGQPKSIIDIAIVGQVASHKGHALLFKALSVVKNTFPNIRLHIIGKGDKIYIEELQRLSKELDIGHLILWRGYISEKREIYKGIDFVVVPSLIPESFGLVTIEPAIFQKPVIAAAIGGIPEIIADGLSGLLFKPNCEEELVEKIMFLLNDPQKIEAIGKKAHEIFKEKYCMEKQLNSFIERISGL